MVTFINCMLFLLVSSGSRPQRQSAESILGNIFRVMYKTFDIINCLNFRFQFKTVFLSEKSLYYGLLTGQFNITF